MLPRLLPLVVIIALAACSDDPVLAPDDEDRMEIERPEELAPADEALAEDLDEDAEDRDPWALIDSSIMADDGGLLILDGLIVSAEELEDVPPARIRSAKVMRTTRCGIYGPGREVRALFVRTVASGRP